MLVLGPCSQWESEFVGLDIHKSRITEVLFELRSRASITPLFFKSIDDQVVEVFKGRALCCPVF